MGGASGRRVYSSRFSARRGGAVPKHPLFRPISIAAATWSRVADGFPKTAETASHFVGDLRRSPMHPANMKANNRAMILMREVYPNYRRMSDFSAASTPWLPRTPWPLRCRRATTGAPAGLAARLAARR